MQAVARDLYHLPRSQLASGLRRQPELCQQAVMMSPLRTALQSLPTQSAWLWGYMPWM